MTAYIGQSGEQTNYEAIVKQHENTVQSSLEIESSNNAVSAGPITMTFCLLSVLIVQYAPIPCSFFDLRGDSKSRSFREPLPKDLPIDDQTVGS